MVLNDLVLKDLVTVRQAAAMLGVEQHVVRDAIRRRQLPCQRVGYAVILEPASVAELKAQREQKAGERNDQRVAVIERAVKRELGQAAREGRPVRLIEIPEL